MASNERPLWPLRARGPWLQLGFGLVAAPLTVAALMTLMSFAIYIPTEPTFESALARTSNAAAGFLTHLAAYTVSFGLASTAGLWALGKSGLIIWAVVGAGGGVLYALAIGIRSGAGVSPFTLLVAAILSAALLVLVRWFAGIRSGRGGGRRAPR